MSQQPPEWWSRQRGPRFGCADVTIVSIAAIAAFVILIFVLLRPDFARVIDVGNANNATVGAVRATETPTRPTVTPTSTAPTVAPTPPAPTLAPTPPPPAFRKANTNQQCRLRQDPSTTAVVIQVFNTGVSFKIYTEQRVVDNQTWVRVEPDDNTNRSGWMWTTCFS